jgi:dihydrofolate synthase/folylpolyglutamate synthase
MQADKDVEEVVGLLEHSVGRWIAADTEGPRGLADDALAARASARGVPMECGGTVSEAMSLAAARARPGDRIVVFGSFHSVGPALQHLQEMQPDGGIGPVWL